jgi:hypothetical protein
MIEEDFEERVEDVEKVKVFEEVDMEEVDK